MTQEYKYIYFGVSNSSFALIILTTFIKNTEQPELFYENVRGPVWGFSTLKSLLQLNVRIFISQRIKQCRRQRYLCRCTNRYFIKRKNIENKKYTLPLDFSCRAGTHASPSMSATAPSTKRNTAFRAPGRPYSTRIS